MIVITVGLFSLGCHRAAAAQPSQQQQQQQQQQPVWKRRQQQQQHQKSRKPFPPSPPPPPPLPPPGPSSPEEAALWWNRTVPVATSRSPPTPGKATLLFVHVPKVGGTSIEDAFERLTEQRKPLCSRRFMDSFQGRPAAVHSARSVQGCQRNNSNLIWGHASLDVPAAARIVGKPPGTIFTMVMLREPFQRLISFANYMGVPRREFEATWSKQMSANTVTSMVNGLRPLGVLNRNRFRGEKGLACAAGGEADQQRAIARAQATLARVFTFVGVTENYIPSLWLLQRVFGWGESAVFGSLVHPRSGFRTFSAAKRGVVPFSSSDEGLDGVRAFVLSREKCDVALHQFADALLSARLQVLPPKERAALRAFEKRVQQAQQQQQQQQKQQHAEQHQATKKQEPDRRGSDSSPVVIARDRVS